MFDGSKILKDIIQNTSYSIYFQDGTPPEAVFFQEKAQSQIIPGVEFHEHCPEMT